jgi:hypothetical protein
MRPVVEAELIRIRCETLLIKADDVPASVRSTIREIMETAYRMEKELANPEEAFVQRLAGWSKTFKYEITVAVDDGEFVITVDNLPVARLRPGNANAWFDGFTSALTFESTRTSDARR